MFKNHLKQKLLLLVFVLVLANGCISLIVQNPKLNNLTGIWESIGPLSYYQLSFSEGGEGLLAIVFDEKMIMVYKLEDFVSQEKSFKVKFVDIEGDEEPVLLNGTIIMGRLLLEDASDPEDKILFIKSKDLSDFRKLASDEIEKNSKK